MAKHRVLYEFASTPGVSATAGSDLGWSELWYDPADSTDDQAEDNARALFFFRRALLSPGWRIVAIRISQLDASNNLVRKGRLIQIPANTGAGSIGLPQQPADEQAWDAINLAIQTQGGSRRAFLMRGIPGNVVGASGIYLSPGQFVINSALYASALAGRLQPGDFAGARPTPFALRTRSAPRQTSISGVFTAPVANVNLIIDQTRPAIRVPINTVQAGMQVSLVGILDMPGMNAQWKVTGVQLDPLNANFNYVVFAPRRRVQIKGAYTQGGVATYWNWSLDNITGFTIGAGASRRTGRPPQAHRGRRSTRRS